MTREEAIVDIRDNIKPIVGGKSLDIAIEALKQEPVTVETINQYCKEHNYVLCEKGTEHGKMLTCQNCGLDVHSDFKYCPRCGVNMRGDADEVSD